MSVIWYKVWSDLWDNKIRTALAILSITAGVFAIGATFGMSDQLLKGMDAAHQASKPAHFTMYFNQYVDENLINDLKKINGIEEIELGSQINIQYKIKPEDKWDTAWLIMRQDYAAQNYALLTLKEGDWPQRNLIGVERLSSQHFQLGLGESVYFKVGDRPRLRKINGKLRHNFVPPPEFGGPAVFFTDDNGMEMFDIPKGTYNEIIVVVTPYSEALARQVASKIKDRLSKEKIGVAVTIYSDPKKHWGRSIMEGVNLVLQIMAIVSLAASSVLVLNTMIALVTQQTHQIGILKAIGGTQGKIMQVYLAGVLVYGLLSLLIALPLGSLLAFGVTRYLLNIFNIDYEEFRFSTQAIGLQLIAAILAPLLTALWPILKGTSITVRQAISSYGLGSGNFGRSRVDRFIEQVGLWLLPASYSMALSNMFRRKERLLLTQTVLILAGTMFLAVMSLSSSLNTTMDNIFAKRHFDLMMIFEEEQRIDKVLKLTQTNPNVIKAEMMFSHGASLLKSGQRLKDAGLGTQLFGVPNGSDMFRPPLMVAGRWLKPDDNMALIIRQDLAEDNDIQLGDTITLDLGELGDDKWQVVGFYKDIFSGVGDSVSVYANLQDAFKASKKYNHGSFLYIKTKSHEMDSVEAIATELKTIFTTAKMDISDMLSEPKNRANADQQFIIIIFMFLVLSIIIATVGGIGLMGSLSISVVERTREIGVMRAIGATTPTILGMFVMEGVLQGLFSWLIVVPISFLLGQPMANALGFILFKTSLDYQYNYGAVGMWLAIILIVSILASIVPARNAVTVSVRDSLAYS